MKTKFKKINFLRDCQVLSFRKSFLISPLDFCNLIPSILVYKLTNHSQPQAPQAKEYYHLYGVDRFVKSLDLLNINLYLNPVHLR
jgi:hypothetical protein